MDTPDSAVVTQFIQEISSGVLAVGLSVLCAFVAVKAWKWLRDAF